jgi:hypothetical protein
MFLGKTAWKVIIFITLISARFVDAEQLGGFDFTGSGFLTLAAGKMLGGTSAMAFGRNCPCFTSDYAQGAVYDGRSGLQLGPDSKLGLQGIANLIDSPFSATAQVVSRGAENGRADIEWLYGNYKLSADTDIQLGRKRLPMFYYSDIQDVGFALPWTHLPPQMYGWEVVNYNGANITHRDRWGDWAATMNLLAGNENVEDSGYWQIYNGQQSQSSVKWDHILGGDLSLMRDWFEMRLVYIQSDTSRVITNSITPVTDPFLLGNVTQQKIYSVAFNIDTSDWLARSEFLVIDRPGAGFRDHAQLGAVGRRFGHWLLLATISQYRSEAIVSMGADPQGQEAHTDRAVTLRYDLNDASDVKVQIDDQKDQGGINWSPRYGDSQLLTIAYDRVF